MLLLSNYSRRP
jgi:hypothetical protein